MSRFGGVPVEEDAPPQGNRFGGIAVAPTPESLTAGLPQSVKPLVSPELAAETAVEGALAQRSSYSPALFQGGYAEGAKAYGLSGEPKTDYTLLEKARNAGVVALAGYKAMRDSKALGKPAKVGQSFLAEFPQALGRQMQGVAAMHRASERRINEIFAKNLPESVADFLRTDPDNLALAKALEWEGAGLERGGKRMDIAPEDESLATSIGDGVSQIVTQATVAYFNPAAAFVGLAGEGAESMERRVESQGAQGTAQADAAILLGGAVTGALEKIQITKLISKTPYLGRLMDLIPDSIKSKWAGKLVDPVAAGAGEAIQEVAEGVLNDAIAKATFDPAAEFLQQWKQEAAAGGGAAFIFRAMLNAVGFRRVARSFEQAKDSPIMKALAEGDFSPEAFKMLEVVSEEEFLASMPEGPAAEMALAAYRGEGRAQEALRLFSEALQLQEQERRQEQARRDAEGAAAPDFDVTLDEQEAFREVERIDPVELMSEDEAAAFEAERDAPTPEEEAHMEREFREQEAQQALVESVDFDNELLSVVKRLGGLPGKDPALQGELDRVRENLRATKAASGLFKRDAKALDELRRSLEEEGFAFDTPAQMVEAISESAGGVEFFPVRGGGVYNRPRQPLAGRARLPRSERIDAEKQRIRDIYQRKLDAFKARMDQRLADERRKVESQKADIRIAAAKRLQKEMDRRVTLVRQSYRDRQDLAEAIKALEAMVKALPVRIRGKFTGFGKLAETATPSARRRFLDKSIGRINAIFETYLRRELRDRINDKVNATEKAIARARRMKRKSPVSIAEWRRFLENVGFASQSQVARATETVNAYLLRVVDEPEAMPSDAEAQALALVGRSQVNDKQASVASLEQLEADIDDFLQGKRLRLQQKEDKRAAEIQRDAIGIAMELADANDKRKRPAVASAIEKRPGMLQTLAERAKGLDLDLIAPETMITLATGKRDGGKMHKAIMQPIFDAADRKSTGLREISETLESFRERAGISYQDAGREVIIDLDGTPLTAQHAMAIYGYSQNERGRAHLRGTRLPDGSLMSDEFIETVSDLLPEEYKTFVDLLIDWYDADQFRKVNAYFKDKYGVELPKESRYLPLAGLDGASAETDLFRDFSNAVLFEKGFLMGRVDSSLGFAKLDLLGNVVRNLTSVEHLVNMEPVVSRANVILNRDEVRKELQRYDPQVARKLKQYLERVARNQPDEGLRDWERVVNALRRNASIALTAVNLASWLKVPMSFSVGAQRVRKAELMQSAFQFMLNPAQAIGFAKGRSEFMRNYENTFNRELREMLDNRQTQTIMGERKTRDRVIDASYFAVRLLAKSQVATLWNAKYAEAINDGLSHDEARIAADRLIRETQPTGRIVDLPAMYANGALWKALTQFTIDINKNYNLFRSLLGSDDPKVIGFLAFAVFSIIMPALIGAFSDLANDELKKAAGLKERSRKDDPAQQFGRDFARYAATQVYGSHPFLAQIVEGAAARAAGDERELRYISTRTPPIFAATSSLVKGDAAFAVGAGLGIPGTNYWSRPTQEIIDELLED